MSISANSRVTAPAPGSQKIASGYVLVIVAILIVVAAWLRGVARFVVPVLLLLGAGWCVAQFVRKVREPLP